MNDHVKLEDAKSKSNTCEDEDVKVKIENIENHDANENIKIENDGNEAKNVPVKLEDV